MGQGALTYSLGLEPGGFFKGIVGANQALELFKKGMSGVQFVMKNVFAFAHEAANLHDLSMRTGVAVGTLYQLRTAFEAVGVGAESTSPILVAWRRALGGTDEFGKKTLEGFKALKLDVGELRKMPLPEGLQKFFETIANMEPNQAMRMTSAIFPRGLAANIMQAARQAEEFKAVMESTRPVGEVMARVAKMADEVLDTWMLFKEKFKLIWGTIAEVIGPPILALVKRLNAIDLGPFAQRIGDVMKGAAVLIQEGKLGDLLAASLTAGLEQFILAFGGMLSGIQKALVEMFATSSFSGGIGKLLWSEIQSVMLDASEVAAWAGEAVGIEPSQRSRQAREQWRKQITALTEEGMGELLSSTPEVSKGIIEAMRGAAGMALSPGDMLKKLLADLVAAAARYKMAPAGGAPGFIGLEGAGAGGGGRSMLTGMKINPLEAMGAIFPGTMAGMGSDAASQTAANTRKTADLIQKNNVLIDKIVTALTSLNPFTRK